MKTLDAYIEERCKDNPKFKKAIEKEVVKLKKKIEKLQNKYSDGLIEDFFDEELKDEIGYDPYYRKIPVLGYITLISNEEIEFRKRYVELLMERNKLKRKEVDN